MPGYSGTPLIKKLGFKAPMSLLVVNSPPDYAAWLGPLPEGVRIISHTKAPIQAAHVFATEREDLAQRLRGFRRRLAQNGFVWVSWPKKASKVQTDITEDIIRDIALPLGFVDVKVCAVSEVWSGLKLMIRQSERKA